MNGRLSTTRSHGTTCVNSLCLADQIPNEQMASLLQEVKLAVKACDEANEITHECRQESGLHFEVDITSGFPRSVIVRALHYTGTDQTGADQYEQQYLWSTRQMMERL